MSAGLRTRPSAETFPLDDLVTMARTGVIRVPSFQRGLRWTRSDVVALFDSVLRGYPIGSLLFWKREGWLEEVVTLGPLRIDAPAGTAYYVVDGQQRITALAAALSEQGENDQRFQVGYDLDEDRFIPRPARARETYIPAHVLFDLSALLSWFRDRPQIADGFDAAAAVSKTLRDLRVPAYVVSQDDEEVLRDIFDRMNNSGKKLTRSEVFGALHNMGGVGGADPLTVMAEAVDARTRFGRVGDGLAMQVVLARRGPDVMREIRNEFDPSAQGRDAFAATEEQGQAYARATDALALAVEFLQNDARVPDVQLLPYQYLLVALARFFAHHPRPTPRSRRLLRRWFWRGVAAGPVISKGNTTGASRSLNRAVDLTDEAASTINLLRVVELPSQPAYPDVNPFKTNSAASRALLCAMWAAKPQSLDVFRDNDPADLSTFLQDTSAVDLALPLAAQRNAQDHRMDAGNRILVVDKIDRESVLLDTLQNLPVTVAGDAILASHLLTRADVVDLQGSSATRAIVGRSVRLQELLTDFLDEMCEWDQEDSPDLTLFTLDDVDPARTELARGPG